MGKKGKIIKRYDPKGAMSPLEKLALLAAQKKVTFKKGHSLKALQDEALQQTDLAAAQQMHRAKAALFESFQKQRKCA